MFNGKIHCFYGHFQLCYRLSEDIAMEYWLNMCYDCQISQPRGKYLKMISKLQVCAELLNRRLISRSVDAEQMFLVMLWHTQFWLITSRASGVVWCLRSHKPRGEIFFQALKVWLSDFSTKMIAGGGCADWTVFLWARLPRASWQIMSSTLG